MNAAKRIYFVSAPCGAGKTRGAAGYIKDNIRHRNFVVVAPTIQLVEHWYSVLTSMGVKADVITSASHGKNVKKTIIEKQNKFAPQGHVLIITWNAYADLPYRPQNKNIKTIIDEVPQTDKFFPWNVSQHMEELKFISIGSPVNERIAFARAEDAYELELSLSALGDDVDEIFREFRRHVLSRNRSVFVDTEAYERVFYKNKISASDRNANRVGFISMLEPKLFEDAIVLGANIEDSVFYHWMTKFHGVQFVRNMDIESRLRPRFCNGRSIELYHFFGGDVRCSKYLFNDLTPSGQRVVDEMDRHVVGLFGDEPFLYVVNNDRKAEQLKNSQKGRRLPVDSRGLNSFSEYDNVYFAAALNREPQHLKMLRDLGLSTDVVYRATCCEQAYQAVLRTSLRDHASERKVRAVVPDLVTATYIAERLGCTQIIKLPLSYGRPKPYSPAEKKQRYRATKALNKVIAEKRVPTSLLKDIGRHPENRDLSKAPEGRGLLASLVYCLNDKNYLAGIQEGNPPTCYVTLHDALRAREEHEHEVIATTPMEFVKLLRSSHGAIQDDKDKRTLFNPGVFVRPDGGSGWRKIDNFRQSCMLVLDFDGGMLSPDDFISVFHADAGPGRRLNFAIYNSFSRSPQQPNRFHVVVFFAQPAYSVEEHCAVYDLIVHRLGEAGVNLSDTGLDRMSATGVQSFYLPCTNRSHPEMAFFNVFGVTAKELKWAVNPALIAKTVARCEGSNRRQSIRSVRTPGDAETIIAPYRGMREGRNRAIFEIYQKLECLGLPHSEIEAHLTDAFGSERKVKKKIKGAQRSVERYRHLRTSPRVGSANNEFG